jgi:hypothetical protein
MPRPLPLLFVDALTSGHSKWQGNREKKRKPEHDLQIRRLTFVAAPTRYVDIP